MIRDQVVGDYRLERPLDSGTFGQVWLAISISTSEEVALKFFGALVEDSREIRKEIESWKTASGHDNIVEFKDWFYYRLEGETADRIVLVSEYLPDGSLFERLKGGLPTHQSAARTTCDILTGLDHLHKNRIVHRDLKPKNILLKGDVLKLVDFGAARLLDFHKESFLIHGTPPYMSPEAFIADRGPHVDVWSAGIILYEMLAGHVPFEAGDFFDLRRMITEDPLPPLPASIPRPLAEIVELALRKKDPVNQRPTAAEMKRMLLEYLGEAPRPSPDRHAAQIRKAMAPERTVRSDVPTEKMPTEGSE